MQKKILVTYALAAFLALLLAVPSGVIAQSEGGDKPFAQEELDQILAPIALYPDSLLAQIFMASTYPLEVVQAGRWVKENPDLKEDALTAALEKETWDPSVKSLVNFPQVLDMMNEKLDWTQKLGDAFLAQQKEVMDTVQSLRAKAEAEGNLESSEEQTVIVEKETIIIQPANPEVVYVPIYNPTVIYGPWWWPRYTPYYYHPPGYVAGAALFAFGVGVARGAAWGYAWGGCNWRRGDVNIDINRNTNINNNINRNKYQNKVTSGQGGRGEWKHNPEHRKGVSYRDQDSAKKFDKGASRDAKSREAYRGRAEQGRKDISRGDAAKVKDRSGGSRQSAQTRPNTGSVNQKDRSGGNKQSAQTRPSTGSVNRGESQQRKSSAASNRSTRTQPTNKSAFGNYNKGSQTRSSSSRGHQSMSSSRSGSSPPRGGGGRGGGGRR